MDIFSALPIIIMIVAIFFKLNKGSPKINQRPRTPYSPPVPWAFNLETSLPKRLSNKTSIPTPEIERTAGVEGTLQPILSSEIKIPQSEKPPYYPDLTEKNLAEAVIWAEILGKPKSRINRPPQRTF